MVTDFLEEYFTQMMEYEFTKSVEEEFDAVANGRDNYQSMLKRFWEGSLKKYVI